MKPEWMPPLPDVEQEIYRLSRRFVGAPVQGAVRQMMTDYALAAVEAYRKSLKPVAWAPRWTWSTRQSEQVVKITKESQTKYGFSVPLYRLDGESDDAD